MQKTIVGHLGNDPVVRPFKSGTGDLVSFSVANQKEEGPGVDWYSCAVFDAGMKKEALALKSGQKVRLTGVVKENEFNGNIYLNLNVKKIEGPDVMEKEKQVVADFAESVKPKTFDLSDIPF